MKIVRPHKVLEHSTDASLHALKLTEGKHAGIIFSYGKVDFVENTDEDRLKLNFEYEVLDDCGVHFNKEDFEQELGDFLLELLYYGLDENEIVYSGGVDENRENDSRESDL